MMDKRIVISLVAILVLAAPFIIRSHTHASFWWQEIPLFYALAGFIVSVLLISVASGLCHWLNRAENYYERGDVL